MREGGSIGSRFFSFIVLRKKLILLGCLITCIILVAVLRRAGYLQAEHILLLVNRFPVWAPVLFTLFYAIMIVVLVPTFPLNLAAGFLWGVWEGTFYTIIATSIGAALSFLSSKYLAADFFRNLFRRRPWVYLWEAIEKNDWKIVAFTRLNPVFPFGLVNYLYGLTSISFKKYLISTILFTLPLLIFFSYLGSTVGGIVLNKGAAHLVKNIFIASFLLTLIVLFWFAIKKSVAGKIKT